MNARPAEIKEKYLQLIDQHLDDLVHLRAEEMQEIGDFAEQLHIYPTHFNYSRPAWKGSR